MAKALILVLRHDPKNLDKRQLAFLEKLYPEGIELRRIDSENYIQHDQICYNLKPAAVILPMDKPIPQLAMEHGVPHIALGEEGVQELVGMTVEFKPFDP